MDCAHDLLTISPPIMIDSMNNCYGNPILNYSRSPKDFRRVNTN